MNHEEFNSLIKQFTEPLPGSFPVSFPYKLSVKKQYDSYTIIDLLGETLPQIAAEIWEQKILQKKILLNNKIVKTDTIVRSGNIITHFSEPLLEPAINNNIQLIYNDNSFLAINKPAPLPVQPCGRFYRNNLISILKLALKNENLKLIHRLDANTTGIVLIAKNQESAKNLAQQFELKSIKKTYLAAVDGIIDKDFFDSFQKIGNQKIEAGARLIANDGKIAHSEFQVLKRFININKTLLRVIPHSGKTNQIRLHLADLGYPITGDWGYQNKNYFKINPFTYENDSLFLHAHQVSFLHPQSKDRITLTAPLPDKFQQLLSLQSLIT